MAMEGEQKSRRFGATRRRLHEIIFEADTSAGRAFDVVLIVSIVASVIAVMADSVVSIHARHGDLLLGIEWFFTILFTIEYVMRLASIGRPREYATSFYGVVDLLAILPTYLSLVVAGSQYLLVIRILRVMRVFRVLKLVQHITEADTLRSALMASRRKVTVFLFGILTMVTVLGSLMYLIEGEASGFDSIPRSVYWSIVTLTTVGYGDISPQTPIGQLLAAMVMITGYAIIAVPTGIVTAELTQAFARKRVSTQVCLECGVEGHDIDARYCKRCGSDLDPRPARAPRPEGGRRPDSG